jgi:hypothetical protein
VSWWKAEYRVGVLAPADIVWGVFTDLDAWAEWNPFFTSARGYVRIGELIHLEQAVPGKPVEKVSPRVLDWAPNDHIHMTQPRFHGLVTSTRYLEIDIMSEEGVIVSVGELFRGRAARFLKSERKALREGFTLMGEAIKTRAESLFAEQRASSPPA